jgi:hypothetical protein
VAVQATLLPFRANGHEYIVFDGSIAGPHYEGKPARPKHSLELIVEAHDKAVDQGRVISRMDAFVTTARAGENQRETEPWKPQERLHTKMLVTLKGLPKIPPPEGFWVFRRLAYTPEENPGKVLTDCSIP